MSFKNFLSFSEYNTNYMEFVAFNDCLYDEYLVEGRRRQIELPSFVSPEEAEHYAAFAKERRDAPWGGGKNRWKDWFSKNPKIDKSDLVGDTEEEPTTADPDPAGEDEPKKKAKPKTKTGSLEGLNHEVLQRTLGDKKAFDSYVVHLTPAAQSGFVTCACASDGCRSTCLQTAGNIGALADKTHARLKKTWFLAKEMPHVIQNLVAYIEKLKAKTEAEGKKLVIRMNGTSDIPWEEMRDQEGKSIPERFPDITFYDYTKIAKRVGKTAPNYHLTFSRSEENEPQAIKMLQNGHNVAVVFGPGKVHNREFLSYPKGSTREGQLLLPVVWHGFKVINGDAHDLRFLEEQPKGQPGVVIGLIAKGAASFEHYHQGEQQFKMPDRASFVVMPNDKGITDYPENQEYIAATHALVAKRNASKQNVSGQFGRAKIKYNTEQQMITGMLAGTLPPEEAAKLEKSPQYKRLKGAIDSIRSYCAKFPSACSRDYLAQASQALLKPTHDPTGERQLPAMPFDMGTLKDIGLVTGRRRDTTQDHEGEFRKWLAARTGQPAPAAPATGRTALPMV